MLTPGNNSNRQLPRYRIEEKIGEGGYGMVFKAIQENTGQKVAVKILKLPTDLGEGKKKQRVDRFEREIQLCARLNHPYLIKMLDKGYSSLGEPFAVFEYLEEHSLKDLIIQKEGLSLELTGHLMGQALEALAYAHSKGVIHRDLKPQNIMVIRSQPNYHLKILDFGIGTFLPEYKNNDFRTLTFTDEVVGTPAYSAPEQLRGEPATSRTDIYAWGLILLECLTGLPAIRGESIGEVFRNQLDPSNVPLPSALVGHPVGEILRKVLEKDQEKRVGNAAALYKEFSDVNFSSLVGTISTTRSAERGEDDATVGNLIQWEDARAGRRQITVLCANIKIANHESSNLDLESLDAIQRDQLNTCEDIGARYGGYVAGRLAGNVLIYFGYPDTSENDARLAGRAALVLMESIQKRSSVLERQHGIRIEIRIGMNTGKVLVRPGRVPDGAVMNHSFDLMSSSNSGSVKVGRALYRLLEPYLDFDAVEGEGEKDDSNPDEYLVVGEKLSEAWSFLKPWSAKLPMIGREKELEVLIELWASAKSGKGATIVLEGQPGIGKSRMIFEFKKLVLSEFHVIYETRCLPEHQNNAMHPILLLIRQIWGLRINDDPKLLAKKVKDNLEEAGFDDLESHSIIYSWFGVPFPESFDLRHIAPATQKKILFDVLIKVLHLHWQLSPVCIVLEDLHWIDPTSEEFLDHILETIGQYPVVLAMTARPEYETSFAGSIELIELKALNDVGTKALIEGVLAGKKVSENAVANIQRKADGIPLFVEELTRMMLTKDYLIEDQGVFDLSQSEDIEDIPTTLQSLLNARIEGLGAAKETAELASAIGREFSFALIKEASLKSMEALSVDLDLMEKVDLINPRKIVGGGTYLFRHALMRDAAYDGMVVGVRKNNHRRVAESLKDHFKEEVKENPFEVARHLAGAEINSEASTFGMKAIEKQMRQSSNREASRLGKIVGKWVSGIDDRKTSLLSEVQLSSYLKSLASLQGGTGDDKLLSLSLKNRDLISEIRELSEQHSENQEFEVSEKTLDQLEVSNEYSIFSYYHSQSMREKSQVLGEKVLEKAREGGFRATELALGAFLSQSYLVHGPIQKAKKLAGDVLEKFDFEKDKDIWMDFGIYPYPFSCAFLGTIVHNEGQCPMGYQYFRRGIDYALQRENQTMVLYSFLFMSVYAAANGQRELCKKTIAEMLGKWPDILNISFLSHYYDMIIDWSKKETRASEAAREVFLKTGQTIALANYELLLIDTHLEEGNYERAAQIASECLERQLSNGKKVLVPATYDLLMQSKYMVGGGITSEVEKARDGGLEIAADLGFNLPQLSIHLGFWEMLQRESTSKDFAPHQREIHRLLQAVDAMTDMKIATMIERYKS